MGAAAVGADVRLQPHNRRGLCVGHRHDPVFEPDPGRLAAFRDTVEPLGELALSGGSMVVPPADVVEAYYQGHSSFFTPRNWGGWIGPICIWTLFILTLMTAMYCVSVLLRRQWVEYERLTFPIVLIPLAVTLNGGDVQLWRSRLFWLGAALPAVVESVNVVHFTMAPAFPYFPIKVDEARNITNTIPSLPWNAIGNLFVTFFPLVIGLTFLISREISFSCWFFYLLTKIERLVAAAQGLPTTRNEALLSIPPYTAEQGLGAFLGLAVTSLWLAPATCALPGGRRFSAETPRMMPGSLCPIEQPGWRSAFPHSFWFCSGSRSASRLCCRCRFSACI